jgi:hypothetical protein
VLAAVKVVFLHMRHISPELTKSYTKKMAPPLGNQLSSKMFCAFANVYQLPLYHLRQKYSMLPYGI